MTPPSRLSRRPWPGATRSGTSPVTALAAILAGMLIAGMIPGGAEVPPAHARSADTSIEYAENGTGPVAAFRARDQDGDAIAWSLGGPDRELFTIDGGVLSFREPPDYEDPRSAASGAAAAEANVYRVTIEASGGRHDVAVRVTDAEEAGRVSISRPQPQVGRPLSAVLSDEDEGVTGERWQWARSVDGTSWTDIEGATWPARSPQAGDEGMYLRATVTYSDRFGPGKTASAVSARRVEARTLSNAAPSFAGRAEPLVRSVRENAAVGTRVGAAVSARDADADVLFYELLATPDLADAGGGARFTVDSATGQIRLAKALGADEGEREDEDSTALAAGLRLPPGEDAGDPGNSEYVLRVRASDPSTASAEVSVIVRVTDINEAPAFGRGAPTELFALENADPVVITLPDGAPVDAATYAATDQDRADAAITYSVTGDDREAFTFTPGGVLGFARGHEPDYEERSSYSITVVATSGAGSRRRTATLDVTVRVADAQDRGEAVLSQRQPQVGTGVHAAVIDPDGGVSIREWRWERSDEITVDGDGAPTAGCRYDPDTPGIDAVGGWAAIDGASSAVYAPRAADVGRCLRAAAIYTDRLHRAAGTGRAAAVDPSRCSEDAQAGELACAVTTGSGGEGVVRLGWAVGTSEAPVQGRRPANAAPRFVDQDPDSAGDQSARTSRKVAENTKAGRSIGAPVTAGDGDGDLLIYTLGGADAGFFGISRTSGQLRTKAALNYEARSSYAVDVIATDPSGATDRIRVTINVIDVHDPVHITGDRSVRYAENGTGPVAAYSASDEEGHAIAWSLGGPDRDLLTIEGGVLTFREPPDYERPGSAAGGAQLAGRNVYRVTVRAAGGTLGVTVTVTDADEAGEVRIDRPQPQEGRPLSASLLDQDGGVTDERWRWARSGDGLTWTDIEGATSPVRSPQPGDEGMFLRASVTYADRFGSGKTASAVSANRVEARTLFNSAPSFAGQDDDAATAYVDVSRTVAENTAAGTAIGEPVSAADADEDLLFYELLDTPDLADEDGDPRFTVDGLSGQIRVGKALGADPGEVEDEDSTALPGDPPLPGDEDAGRAGNGEYVLRLRASDPSTAADVVNVVVRVAEVNEPPRFAEDAPTVLRVRENQEPPVIRTWPGDGPVGAGTYAVTDQDGIVPGPGGHDDTAYTYSVAGPDSDDLAFSGAGILGFREGHQPDFEDRSSYSITVVARSGEGSRGLVATLNLTIEVVDGEDPGAVVLSQRQPQVGIAVHARVSDEDGGVAIKRWRWERSGEVTVSGRGIPSAECRDDPGTPGIDAAGGWAPIAGATSAVYTPTAADAGRCLRATATYADNIGSADDHATGVLEVPARHHHLADTGQQDDGGFVNAAPVFPDQDFAASGDQSDETIRTVAENTEAGRNIGAPVSADDDDGDLLIYTLGGADAAAFGISRNDGQLKTKAALDYETRDRYTVVVTATDPFGAADSIVVTVNVTDEDDPAVIRILDE